MGTVKLLQNGFFRLHFLSEIYNNSSFLCLFIYCYYYDNLLSRTKSVNITQRSLKYLWNHVKLTYSNPLLTKVLVHCSQIKIWLVTSLLSGSVQVDALLHTFSLSDFYSHKSPTIWLIRNWSMEMCFFAYMNNAKKIVTIVWHQ